jgi:hypothetical protein
MTQNSHTCPGRRNFQTIQKKSWYRNVIKYYADELRNTGYSNNIIEYKLFGKWPKFSRFYSGLIT